MGLQGTMAIMKKLGVYVSVVNHIVGLVVEEEESLLCCLVLRNNLQWMESFIGCSYTCCILLFYVVLTCLMFCYPPSTNFQISIFKLGICLFYYVHCVT